MMSVRKSFPGSRDQGGICKMSLGRWWGLTGVKGAVGVLIVCAGLLACTGSAVARMPWWHVSAISAPATKPGGEGDVVLEVSNLGDAWVPGFFSSEVPPVKIDLQLPTGVVPVAVHPGGGGGAIGREFGTSMSCSIEGQTVVCTYGLPLLAYEHLIVTVDVKVAPGMGEGLSEAHISGGGAPPVVWRHALALGDTPPPYGAQNYELTPEEEGGALDTQAGSHPFQLTSTLTFDTKDEPVTIFNTHETLLEIQPIEQTKDLTFDLPPGLVGNPTPLPKCSLYTFLGIELNGTPKCPSNTVVGVATTVAKKLESTQQTPFVASEALYSLEPSVGEPARFGFVVPFVGPVILDTAVRTGAGYGVVVSVPDIFNHAFFIGSQVTFWGVPADPRHETTRGLCLNQLEFTESGIAEQHCTVQEPAQPFLDLPASCTGPLRTSVQGDSWEDAGHFSSPKEYLFANSVGETYGMDGCNRLNFEPSVSLTPDGQEGATPTGLTVDAHVPQEASLNPAGLAESTVKNTVVTLPAGIGINPAGADGLQACSLAQVGLESAGEQTCPEASKIGTVEIHTPLLPNPLAGAAYLAQQDANPFGSLIAMYVVVKDPVSGVIVKLAGEVKPDLATGQLVSTFDDTPPLPFEDFKLHFFGGSRAPLGTPALCGSYTTTASIAPWSGTSPVDSRSTFVISSGPNHTPCADPLPFQPELTAGSLNIQAGAFTPFAMTMSREDGNQNLEGIQLKMPSGLLGEISKVKLCEEAEANAGTCGPESLIGETTVSVGLGGNPYTVKGGKVYITGPYHGAPYGLSIVNPAKAGPFDLGQVIVRAKIEVNPTNAAITIVSDTSGPYKIPQIIEGIPLQIKHVNVTITRPEFTFNPTDCEPQQIGGSLTSTEGSVSVLHVPFQVTNCAVLSFKPVFSVSTNAKTSRADGASLHVKLTYPKAPFGTQANIGYVKVDLPKQLPSRLETLKKACPDTVFNTNPAACPPESRVGHATATTPVLPVFLEGPAYFVSHGGAKFPELIVALSGQGVTVYLHGETFISKGITSSTFHTIPDVPVGTFELTLPEGPYSALAANGNLCSTSLTMPTDFHGANGVQLKRTTKIDVTGCTRHRSPTRHNRKRGQTKKHKKN